MGSFFGGLLGGAANLIGGLFGQQNQAQINAANIANQDFLAGGGELPNLVANAKAAGLNPLAALGYNAGSPVAQVGSNALGEGIGKAGQDIGRAVSSAMSPDDKSGQLNDKLTQARIDNVQADTTQKLAAASVAANTFGQPGTMPTPHTARGIPADVPLPTPDPRREGTLPLYQDYFDGQNRIRLLSRPASESVMNSSSISVAPLLGAGLAGENALLAGKVYRGDIMRAIRNLGSSDDSPPVQNYP